MKWLRWISLIGLLGLLPGSALSDGVCLSGCGGSGTGGGSIAWASVTGKPAGFADNVDDQGSLPTTGATNPTDGVTACANIGELYENTFTHRPFMCASAAADTWVPLQTTAFNVVIDMNGKTATTTKAEWYAALKNVISIVDADCTANQAPWACCSGAGVGSCDDTAGALQGGADCTAMAAQLPFRIKLIGTFDSGGNSVCDFAEATDFGDARACLSIFKSQQYAAGVPVPDGLANGACTANLTPYACCTGNLTGTCGSDYCIIGAGLLTVDVSEATINMAEIGFNADCTANLIPYPCCTGFGAGTCTPEPIAAFMVGAGYMAGFTDASASGALQAAQIAGLSLNGPLTCTDQADVDTDWTGADVNDEIPSLNFDDAPDSSSTTAICLWINGNTQLTADKAVDCKSNTNLDIDDWCLASQDSFQSNISGLRVQGMNAVLLEGGSNIILHDVDATDAGGTASWGYVQGNSNESSIPVDAGCSSGFCGQTVYASSTVVASDLILQAYDHLIAVGTFDTFYLNNAYAETGGPDPETTLIGFGSCSSDHSVCALDSDCAAGTCAKITVGGGGNGSASVFLSNIDNDAGYSFGPSFHDPFAAIGDYTSVGFTLTGRSVGNGNGTVAFPICTANLVPLPCCTGLRTGTCPVPLRIAGVVDQVTGGSAATAGGTADASADLSGLISAYPLGWPVYSPIFTPQVSDIFANNAVEASACQAETHGQYRQRCTNLGVTPHSLWLCNPANAGASPVICDNSADWEQIGGGGSSGNSFQTIDAPSGTDPVADSATDTLLLTCSNGLTCTGSAGADSLALAISAGGLADASMATSYSGTGACGGVLYAKTLNDAAAPTCQQVAFTDLSGTFAQAQIGANTRIQFGVSLDFNADGDPEVYTAADGVGPICTAGRGPCTCFKAPADSSGTQRACIIANGAYFSGDAEATTAGNFFGTLDNDGASGSMSCKNRGAAGELQNRDVNNAAADRFAVCEGVVEIGTVSDYKTIVNKTATGALADPSTADGAEFEANDTIVTNSGAGGAIVLTLPVAIPGQCISVYHVTAFNFDLNPNGVERILDFTNANGDAIRSTTVRNSLELCAIATSTWAVMSCKAATGIACVASGGCGVGTWSDCN